MKLMMQKHGLPDGGWTVQRQRQLVRWVLFCTCWPELVGHALEPVSQAVSDEDVLTRTASDYANEVKDRNRRERLNAIAAEEGDQLPFDAIDTAFRFVARSTLLVEDLAQQ
jgi:hypothetical protein